MVRFSPSIQGSGALLTDIQVPSTTIIPWHIFKFAVNCSGLKLGTNIHRGPPIHYDFATLQILISLIRGNLSTEELAYLPCGKTTTNTIPSPSFKCLPLSACSPRELASSLMQFYEQVAGPQSVGNAKGGVLRLVGEPRIAGIHGLGKWSV